MPLHVLLVEDDDGLRHAYGKILTNAGHIFHPFPDYRGVLELLDAGERADVLLIDILLPPGTPHGVSLAAMARFRRPNLPVVFLTGHTQYADFVGQSDQVLLKPITDVMLLQAVIVAHNVAYNQQVRKHDPLP
jgi:DNA-binding NtrC family response regulator